MRTFKQLDNGDSTDEGPMVGAQANPVFSDQDLFILGNFSFWYEYNKQMESPPRLDGISWFFELITMWNAICENKTFAAFGETTTLGELAGSGALDKATEDIMNRIPTFLKPVLDFTIPNIYHVLEPDDGS